jgi:adenylylsulfate kinase
LQLRNKLKNHRAVALWFTGLSGAGKTTVSERTEQILSALGIHTYILDGDNVRMGLNKDLGFSEAGRSENLRRSAEVAKLFIDAGIVVLCAFVSPLEKDREMVKNIIGSDFFVEIFINTSLEECERRDVKGLYKRARSGEIKDFTGISATYEIPQHPLIEIKTEILSIDAAAQSIVNYMINTLKINT